MLQLINDGVPEEIVAIVAMQAATNLAASFENLLPQSFLSELVPLRRKLNREIRS